jgi:Fur family peroxide stress response transcriptional regulator
MKRTARELEARVGELIDRCRAAGMNLTPQRVVIYRALLDSEDHPSPEALRDRVKAQLPAVSLATIYKTLDVLVELGLAAEVPVTGNTKRYDGNMGVHHHLVCTACGSVADTDDVSLSRISLPKGLHGFLPKGYSVHIRGLCSTCRNHPSPKEKKSWPKN